MAQVAGRKSLKNMVTSPYEHWKPLTDSQFYGAMGDFVQFCKESIILDKNGRPVPMHLNEAQVLFSSEVLKAIEPIMKKIPTKSVNVLCHKSRQMGITTVTLKLEQFVASKSTNFNILHVMPTDSEANEMIDRKFLPLLRGTHPELLADIVPVANYADFKSFSGIELDNRITFMSAGVKGAGHGRLNFVSEYVITANKGEIKWGDVKVGDMLFDRYGSQTMVTDVFHHKNKQKYRLYLKDGRYLDSGAEHLWLVAKQNLSNDKKENTAFTAETQWLLNNNTSDYAIPNNGSMIFPSRYVGIDPYLLGVALGDGYILKDGTLRIKSKYKRHVELLGEPNWDESEGRWHKSTSKYKKFFIKSNLAGKKSHNKFIPREFLFNSTDIRKDLLAGLLDTDGCAGYKTRFNTVSKQLAEDVQWLVRSLGGYSKISKQTKVRDNELPYYTVSIAVDFNPFRRPEKAVRYNPVKIPKWSRIDRIEALDEYEDAKCVTVDSPTHTYVIGKDFIVTHNTIHMLVEDEHCFGDDVEIMTDKGLISIADVTEDTLVAQWNDDKVSFVKPTYLHRYDNPSDVYELTTHNGQKNIVTGKHEFVLKSRTTGNYVKKKLTDINFNNLWHIPMSGEGSTERKLSYLDRLVIAAQADGHVSRVNNDCKSNMHIRFCLKLERKIARLKFLSDSAGFSYKECESHGFTYIDIDFPKHIDVKDLSSYFSFDANPETAKSILDEMVFWDGHKEKNDRLYYSSKNKTNVEFFAYMGFQSGYNSCIGYQDPVWRCRLKPGESRSIRCFKREKVDYDKPVYCVTVPSGNIVVKLGTGLYVTGNSKYSDPFNLEAGILPAMSGNTVRIVLFTAKGMNHSFDLSKVAQDPESDWVYIFLPWYILSEYEMEPEGRYKSLNSLTEYDLFLCSEFKRAGISPSRWARKLQWYNYTFINEAKKDQLYMFENYPTVAAESFQASGAPIFDSRLLYDWMEREFKTIDAFYADGETRFDYVDGGAIKEYEAPIKNHQYIIGLDPAEGEVKGDDSALVVWDITKPKIKAVAAYNGIISQNDFAELAYDMAMRYNMALLVPERNMGSLMIKWLTEVKGYLNIWTDANKVTGYNNLGVRTTVSSKNEMIARLKFLMNNGYYEDFDPVFCEQGLYFTFQKTASGQLRAAGDSGHHDMYYGY